MNILINKYLKSDILLKILLLVILLFNVYFIYEFIKLANINNSIINVIIDTSVTTKKCIQFRNNIIEYYTILINNPNIDLYSMIIIIIDIIFGSIFCSMFLINCFISIICNFLKLSQQKTNNCNILRLIIYIITFLNILMMFCFLIDYIIVFNNYKNMEKCFTYSDFVNEGLYKSCIMLISIVVLFLIYCVFIICLELYNLYESLNIIDIDQVSISKDIIELDIDQVSISKDIIELDINIMK